MMKKICVIFVSAMLIASPVCAQEAMERSGVESPLIEQPRVGQAVEEISDEKVVGEQEGEVSLDFRDADIQNVLRILALKSGVNIVTGPEVTGLVTIQLKDVPWKRALEVILETYGYGYQQKGEIISVTTIENLKKRREDAQLLEEQEQLVTKTFVLNYATASVVIASIEKMKTDRGSINYDDRTNALIVRDIESNV